MTKRIVASLEEGLGQSFFQSLKVFLPLLVFINSQGLVFR
jgi:hypothetical protein